MSRRLPSLTGLRAFEAAARQLSFSKAAAELFVTPAAISHQVKDLEDQLGTRLFRRLNRSVTLTESGQALLPPLREGFDRLADAVAALRARDRSGLLNVSAAPSFAAKWLVPRLARFQARHPDIDVRLSATMHLVDFAREGIDVAIRYGRGRYPGLEVEKLLANEVFPVVSPALLKGGRRLRRPDDLRHFTLLHDETPSDEPVPADWPMWLRAAGATQVDAARGQRFSMYHLAIDAAVNGDGVALARSGLVADDLAARRLVRPFALTLPTEFAFWVVCPKATAAAPKTAAFRAWLRDEAAGTA